MKKIIAFTLVGLVLALGLAPPAEAHGFGPGFAVGAATGLVFGTLLAAPRVFYAPAPAYYYAPAPVYVAPPPPVCYQTYAPGYWATVPLSSGGYTTYQHQWVPDRHQTVCR